MGGGRGATNDPAPFILMEDLEDQVAVQITTVPSSGGDGTANQGYAGGDGGGAEPPWLGGGGGGAGGTASAVTPSVGGVGGTGVQVLGIAGPSSSEPSWGLLQMMEIAEVDLVHFPSPVGGLFGGGGGGAI